MQRWKVALAWETSWWTHLCNLHSVTVSVVRHGAQAQVVGLRFNCEHLSVCVQDLWLSRAQIKVCLYWLIIQQGRGKLSTGWHTRPGALFSILPVENTQISFIKTRTCTDKPYASISFSNWLPRVVAVIKRFFQLIMFVSLTKFITETLSSLRASYQHS